MKHHVLVLEDEPLTRVSLSAALDAQDDVEVVCQAATAQEALECGQKQRIDIAFLDIYLGRGPSGIDVAWILRRTHPSVGIVFLTSLKDPRLLGADYRRVPPGCLYLTKSSIGSMRDLVLTIDQARRGTPSTPAPGAAISPGPFTTHQIEILKHVSRGLSNSDIARELSVTEKAVEATISRLTKTLGLSQASGGNRRVHIVRTYLENLGILLP